MKRVRARDLQPGDRIGSGEVVAARPQAGLRTPRGKVEVTLLKDGQARLGIWGASTLIGVKESNNA